MYFYHVEDSPGVPWLMNLKRCGHGQVMESFAVSRSRTYPYANLHLVEAGRMEVTYKGKVIRLEAGSLFILPAFEAHSYRALSNRTVLRWIEFEGGQSDVLTKEVIRAAGGCQIGGDDKTLALLKKSQRIDNQIHQRSASIYALLMALLGSEAMTKRSSVHEKEPLLKVTNFIESHLNEALSMEQLADIGGFSKSYLNRLFKKHYSVTPGDYIYTRRVAKAKVLLADRHMHLADIAAECGFYDGPHLIHRFTEVEGMSPSAYRKETEAYSKPRTI